MNQLIPVTLASGRLRLATSPALTGSTPLYDLPRGVIVGTVELYDCTGEEGDYLWHVREPERAERLLKPSNHPQPSWFRPC